MVVPCALYLRFLFIHQGALHAGAALNGNIRPVPRRTASFVKVFYHPQFFVFFLMHLTPIFSAPFACNPILRNVLYIHGIPCAVYLRLLFIHQGALHAGSALNGKIQPVPRRTASFVKVFYHPQLCVFFLMHLTLISQLGEEGAGLVRSRKAVQKRLFRDAPWSSGRRVLCREVCAQS